MFSFFHKKLSELELKKSHDAGYNKAREEAQAIRYNKMKSYSDAPIIVVPNEWSNPIVGFAKKIEVKASNNYVLLIDNYLSEPIQEVISNGIPMHYSAQRLEVVLSLDPYQLFAIAGHEYHGRGNFDRPKLGVRWDKERCMEVLKSNDFFERLEKFKKKDTMIDYEN